MAGSGNNNDEKNGIWQGGTTNKTQMSEEEARFWRSSEDYFDTVDSEVEFRADLVQREKLMKQQEEKNPIRSKFGDYNAELDRKNQINTMMDKPAPISGGEPRNRYRRPEGSEVGVKKEDKE